MVNPYPEQQPTDPHLTVVEQNQQPPKNPWRRYFARLVDNILIMGISLPFYIVLCLIAGIIFGLLSTLEIQEIETIVNNAPDAIYNILYMVVAGISMILMESLLLCTWGTTPGKWMFGLHVRNADEQILSWSQALKRSTWVNGALFGLETIPLLGVIGSIVFLLWQRRKLLDSGYTSWDEKNHTIVKHV